MAKLCPKCGSIYSDDDKFCHLDGSVLQNHPVSPPSTGSHPIPPEVLNTDKYLGKTILGQFEILEKCGSGSMGTVYKAKQTSIERIVAIKILHPQLANQPEAVLRFHREAKVISNLNHPNIVHIYLFGHLPDGNLYIVQEFVDGRSLASEMIKPLNIRRTIHIAKQILSAIGEAHANGVIHRDLKPENIMLTWVGDDSDFVKILDFGVAKKIVTQTFATREGLIFGSPKYISPEAALGEKVDSRSDLYSLGVILYQMLSGEVPFKGETPIELLMAHINAHPLPLRMRPEAKNIPPELEAIIMKLLEKNPSNRFPTALATKNALAQVEKKLWGASEHFIYTEQHPPGQTDITQPPTSPGMQTVRSAENFASVSEKTPSHSGIPGSDYTTKEDIIGTQELYYKQIRREKIKRAVTILGVIIAIPVSIFMIIEGYKLFKKALFPYDRIISDRTQEGEKLIPSNKESQEEEKAKLKKDEPPNANQLSRTQETLEPSVDIAIENEEFPETGKTVKLIAILSNEKAPVRDPHFLIKTPAGLEIRLPAGEILEKKDGKKEFRANFEFTYPGANTVLFASSEKKYSPSVKIHVLKKVTGKKEKSRSQQEIDKEQKSHIKIREIEPENQTTKPSPFGPDISPPENVQPPPAESPPHGIKIIEKNDNQQSEERPWY